jgi:CBS domain-containing protein
MTANELTVGDLMTTALITVHAHDTIKLADTEMRLADIRHLPVIDQRGNVVGILSNRDLLRAIGKSHLKKVRVGDVMSTDVKTLPVDASARHAARLMLDYKFGCIPIVGSGGELVGLITETDFLRLSEKLLGEPHRPAVESAAP